MADNNIFTKDPDAVLDYVADWSAWLGTDTISSVTWVVPSGITKESDTNTDTTATIWLSGGTVGVRYDVICRIATVGGRTDDRTLYYRVKQK